MLRTLDEQSQGWFRLVITVEASVGLRGLDYRAYSNGITFITLRAFRHYREMIQAAKRVGRAGDRCKRIQVGDWELIHSKASCLYKRRLIEYLN